VGTNGNVTVTGAAGGYTAVSLGNGNDVVSIGGAGDVILLGNGNNTVSGTQGMAFISTGSGNDTIVLGGSCNTVSAGGGINTITDGTGHDTFILPGAGQGFDNINGFQLTNGDLLNVDAALRQAGWNGNQATLGNYFKVTDSGGNATLAIAPGGNGAGTAIAELNGIGNITLATLLGDHVLMT
jgi:Ca2+-binding RTX toxin-like protein